MFCKSFLRCSTGRWAETADIAQPYWYPELLRENKTERMPQSVVLIMLFHWYVWWVSSVKQDYLGIKCPQKYLSGVSTQSNSMLSRPDSTLDTLTLAEMAMVVAARAQLRESYSTPPMLIRNPNSPWIMVTFPDINESQKSCESLVVSRGRASLRSGDGRGLNTHARPDQFLSF